MTSKIKQNKFLLEQLQQSLRPMSQHERDLVDYVDNLPIVEVSTASRSVIEWMRMKPNECHQNTAAYTRLDPSKSSKQVMGWMVDEAIYVAHSVIEVDGRLTCITPKSDNLHKFRFAKDPRMVCDIVEITGGISVKPKHLSGEFMINLRRNPELIRETALRARRRLRMGLNPYY